MRPIGPTMSLIVGLVAVALSTVHLTTRLSAVSDEPADLQVATSSAPELVSGGIYRLDLSRGKATLPCPPAGSRWRMTLVSHRRCDAEDQVTLSKKQPATISSKSGQTSRLGLWRTEFPQRLVKLAARENKPRELVRRTSSPSRLSPIDGLEVRRTGNLSPAARLEPIGPVNLPADVGAETPRPRSEPNGRAEFDLAVQDLPADDPRAYVTIRAASIAKAEGVTVYHDIREPTGVTTDRLSQAILRAWRDHVTAAISPQFTRPVFREPIAIVLTPALGQLRGGTLTLDGMLRPDDLRKDLPRPFSAGRPVIWLNSRLQPGDRLETVLAHEAMHLACAETRLEATGTVAQELWLNEGLAHLGERFANPGWSNLADRLRTWSRATHAAPLRLDPEVSPARWRDPGCRAAAYLFTDWAARRHGPGFVEAVCTSPASGMTAVSTLVDESEGALLEAWALACLLVDRPELLEPVGVPHLVELPTALQPVRVATEGTYPVAGSAMLLVELDEAAEWHVTTSDALTAVVCAVPIRR
jgi:hypothetical protein